GQDFRYAVAERSDVVTRRGHPGIAYLDGVSLASLEPGDAITPALIKPDVGEHQRRIVAVRYFKNQSVGAGRRKILGVFMSRVYLKVREVMAYGPGLAPLVSSICRHIDGSITLIERHTGYGPTDFFNGVQSVKRKGNSRSVLLVLLCHFANGNFLETRFFRNALVIPRLQNIQRRTALIVKPQLVIFIVARGEIDDLNIRRPRRSVDISQRKPVFQSIPGLLVIATK